MNSNITKRRARERKRAGRGKSSRVLRPPSPLYQNAGRRAQEQPYFSALSENIALLCTPPPRWARVTPRRVFLPAFDEGGGKKFARALRGANPIGGGSKLEGCWIDGEVCECAQNSSVGGGRPGAGKRPVQKIISPPRQGCRAWGGENNKLRARGYKANLWGVSSRGQERLPTGG